ncbi:MAG TPA: energy transducer TonB, partial [Acidobacteriaceae bacterium]
MTNQVLPPPDMEAQQTRRIPLEPHLFNPVVDEPVWRTWLGTVRGLFVRENLPPLVLTSHPVAVPDPF